MQMKVLILLLQMYSCSLHLFIYSCVLMLYKVQQAALNLSLKQDCLSWQPRQEETIPTTSTCNKLRAKTLT